MNYVERTTGADRWRCVVTLRGPFGGVREFRVDLRDCGLYSGGATEGRWFTHIETVYDRVTPDELAFMRDLLADDLLDASAASRWLCGTILSYHGLAVPA